MTILQSILLGIIEGITEFLPISSTGHLILAGNLLNIFQSDFVKSFEIIIQLGAILSVVVLYWKSFFNVENLKKIIIASIPTGIIGLGLYKIIKSYLLGNQTVVLWSLLLGGIGLIAFELWHKEPKEATGGIAQISVKNSLLIGLFQSISVIPGVSRSAATIVGGLFLGIKRQTIVEFSFLLAVPTMMAASGLDLVKSAHAFSANELMILAIGFGVSFIVALASIKFLIGFVKKHSFIPFGVYRIFVAIVYWLVILKI